MLFSLQAIWDTPVDSWGGGYGIYMAGIFFQKFLDKLMQRERDLAGSNIVSKISYPLPPESQLDPPINAVFALPLINRLTPPPPPTRTKGTVP